ncbi:nuclear transport factor 2 family protein [Actinoallomurus rhizosphaericola]|uniref:nuclear transport factor 2 family protein n=1 Tax=Actinoallomurus rhizosphaericola TaxID=2952536 RepID=UPI0020902CF4|nr:nuclear transport factor 2 family protein [Actinoallomurus rhizosphaericola]MCO5993876.1 nuclear transport factor 2 family protein [Actinoallomurus rhizosphaericola]
MGFTTDSDVTDFLTDYITAMGLSDQDPGEILDRYFVPDFEYVTEEAVLDRQRMIDHVRPARRNVGGAETPSLEVDVHDALVSGDRIAARYTLRTTLRRGKTFEAEIFMFGRLAHDGRIHRIEQTSRPPAARS